MKEMEIPYYTQQTQALLQFLDENYSFRRNVLTGTVEFIEKERGDSWQPLRKYDQNTITLRALQSGVEAWDKDVRRFVESSFVKAYNPLREYLEQLPPWDHHDRLKSLAHRVPTKNKYWEHDFHQWFRAMVAQWMQINPEHGNTLTPLLIGKQGDGKSTFCRLILPPELRTFYTDRIDFANRNEAVQALVRFALINIDEYDSISRTQNAFLKHILQKADFKARRAYSSVMETHLRYASFIATTNNLQPLTDPSGSRRFLCIETCGSIDLKRPINYRQLYAQAVEEIADGLPTFFSRQNERRIQRSNLPYKNTEVIAELVNEYFKVPENKNEEKQMTLVQMLRLIRQRNPGIGINRSSLIKLGFALISAGFTRKRARFGMVYTVAIRDK